MKLFCLVCGLGLTALPAVAQTRPDFSDLKVKVGDTIPIVDLTGARVSGRLNSLSPFELTMDGHRFKPMSGMRIERIVRYSIWDGAAGGSGIGALPLLPVIPETFGPTGGAVRVNNGLFWGFIGASIDRARKNRITIYNNPR